MTWQPTEVGFPIALPTLAELLGGKSCPAWLSARHDVLARSPAMVEQAAAVGLVARLWCPEDRATRTAILEGSVEHPSAAAARWVRSIGEAQSTLSLLAFHRAAELRSVFYALESADEDPSEESLRAMLYERDILESVRALLAYVGHGRNIGRELALTDVAAVTCYSAMPATPGIEADSLLRAVFLTEPDAWWGGFAAPSGVTS